jgi:hypothetical protein
LGALGHQQQQLNPVSDICRQSLFLSLSLSLVPLLSLLLFSKLLLLILLNYNILMLGEREEEEERARKTFFSGARVVMSNDITFWRTSE